MDWFEFLKNLGPFSTPLCVGMGGVLLLILKDRTALIKDLKLAQADATSLRDKRTEDAVTQAKEFLEHGEATRIAISENSNKLERVIFALEILKGKL